MFVDVLPRWERYTYWIVGLSSIAYSLYVLHLEGEKYKDSLTSATWQPGWTWINRKQDLSDDEWWIWRSIIFTVLPLNIVHVLLSQACFYFRCEEKAKYLGFAASDKAEYMYLVAAAFFHLHLISFAIEKIRFKKSKSEPRNQSVDNGEPEIGKAYETSRNKTQEIRYSSHEGHKDDLHPAVIDTNKLLERSSSSLDCDPGLSDMLFYSFYLPTFFDGPTFLYSDFHTQVKDSFRSTVYTVNLQDIVIQLLRLMFWALFIEFQFHFLYFTALSLHEPVVQRMSLWAVAGMGYYQGQFFMVKYLCMYGISMQISRFDGVIPLPVPRCISWVYSYTDMWKYFDVGLYRFIKKYIFIPCGGSKAGFLWRIISSALAFMFIYFWHGAQYKLLVWCVGNYIMGTLEASVLQLEQSSFGVRLKSKISPAMQLRLKASVIAPVYLVSCFQIFYFFFNTHVGWAIIERMVTKASWNSIIAEYILLTVNIHNALYICQRHTHKGEKCCMR